MKTQGQHYFHLLNALRGIAALLVVGRHTYAYGPFIFPVSYMAVDIFFLLSGVVIEANYRDRLAGGMTPLSFLWLRIVRIYPLYILGSAITLATICLAPHHGFMLGSTLFVVPHLALRWLLTMLFLPGPLRQPGMYVFDPPTWSLLFELLVNAIYGFVLLRLNNRNLGLIIALAGLGLIANLAYFHAGNLVELGFAGLQTALGGLCRAGFSFFVGVALFRLNLVYDLGFIRRHSGVAALAIICVTAALLMAPVSSGQQLYIYVACVFFAFPVLIYGALAVQPSRWVGKIFDFLGDISYPVYALHWPLFCFVSSIIVIEVDPQWFAQWPLTGIGFMAPLLVLAYGMDKTYDRWARSFLKNRRLPRGIVTSRRLEERP